MPRFKVIQCRDAVQRFEVEIEAVSAEAALALAREKDCAWEDCGVACCDSADMEVRDAQGRELIPSHQAW